MGLHMLPYAIEVLQEQYANLDWTYYDVSFNNQSVKRCNWPGVPDDEIMLTIHKSNDVQETFHHHDYFFFNYTYKGQYESLSYKFDNRITIYEKELYAGQPFAGHALCVHDNQETIIMGVLIQKDVFFREFLPLISANSKLFHFFLDPATNSLSDEIMHFRVEDDCIIRIMLELMVIEYAYKKEDTQDILKPMALAFLMQIARQYALVNQEPVSEKLSDRIIQYMGEHFDTVTLKDIARHFSYHPNYISTLLRRDIGKSFSEILLEQRMERAVILLKGTDMPISEIALMLGYTNSSNFYKAFREFYKVSPREYI
jgi:AraC-like DNA-binding protein